MNKSPTPFLIVITEKVTFKDRTGTVLKVYEVGDVIYATAELNHCYATTMGGIFFTEARKVEGEELITYAHQNGDGTVRFRQYAKDTMPPWSVEHKLEV